VEEAVLGSGYFVQAQPHAFTNYDINTAGPRFWRVTYEVGEGLGEMEARVGDNHLFVRSGVAVPDGTQLAFDAPPPALLNWWDIGERLHERVWDVQENALMEVPFAFFHGGTDAPLLHTISIHTHVIGNFIAGYSITYEPNGGEGEPHIVWVPAGEHTITHEVAHEDENMHLLGWNTAPDGSGTFFALGESIVVSGHVVLYAQWGQATTQLTISKTVTGSLGNQSMYFDFTIFFQDSNRNPLPAGTQFNHSGSTTGILTLENEGSAVFRLRHGQTIMVEDVPRGGHVQVIEAPDGNYDVSFTDSGHENTVFDGNDTGWLTMTEERTIGFVNARLVVVPTGLHLNNMDFTLLLTLILGLAAAGFASGAAYRKWNHQRKGGRIR